MFSKVRLFIAIELPEEIKKSLVDLQREIPGMTWTKISNLHLTLCFIGEVGLEQKARIQEGLGRVCAHPFSLSLSGLGMFFKKTQAVLWAGLQESSSLSTLKNDMVAALADLAELPRAQGRFTPHITLGRMKKPDKKVLQEFVAQFSDVAQGTFRVEHMTLFRSILAPGGARHVVEERYLFLECKKTQHMSMCKY